MTAKAREYFYHVDDNGRLFHDATELTDEKFLNFFYKRLKENDTGQNSDWPFVSPCGPELNFVRCLDRPLYFHRLEPDQSGPRLFFAPGLSVAFEPGTLRFSRGGRLLHPAPVGHYGAFDRTLTLQLADCIEPWGPYYQISMGCVHQSLLTQQSSDHVNAGGQPKAEQARSSVQTSARFVIEPLQPTPGWRLLRPRADNACFACGGNHPGGLALSFLFREESKDGTRTTSPSAQTWFTPDEHLQGSHGWMHGGFIALLLDEVMGKVLSGLGIRAPTANLNVNFVRPVAIGRPLSVRAELVGVEGRKHSLKAQITAADEQTNESASTVAEEPGNGSGKILAEATGLFVTPRVPGGRDGPQTLS